MRKISVIVTVIMISAMGFVICDHTSNLVEAHATGIYEEIRLDTDGYATYARQSTPTTNYGTDGDLRAGGQVGAMQRTFLYFDISMIPASATIINATLWMDWYKGGDATMWSNVTVHTINSSWSETQATWNNRLTGTAWDNPGGDYNYTVLTNLVLTEIGTIWRPWDLTDAVRDFHSGALTNNGFLFKNETEPGIAWNNLATCHSDDYYQPSNRPYVEIYWTIEEVRPISLEVDPNNPMINQSVYVNVTIMNDGLQGSGEFNVTWYMDGSPFTYQVVADIPGNRSWIYLSKMYSDPIQGNHTFRVYVDSDDNLSNEDYPLNNNITETVFFISDFWGPPGSLTTIKANKWTWLGYLNLVSKTGAQLYSEISNCQYVVMQNITTGYYYTYGPGIEEDFTITYGSAVAILASAETTWDHT